MSWASGWHSMLIKCFLSLLFDLPCWCGSVCPQCCSFLFQADKSKHHMQNLTKEFLLGLDWVTAFTTCRTSPSKCFLFQTGNSVHHMQDFTKDERRALAQQSRRAPPTHGSEAKQSIINSLHMRMLAADKVCTKRKSLTMSFCSQCIKADDCH